MWRKRRDRASDKHHVEWLTWHVTTHRFGGVDVDIACARGSDAHARRVGEFAVLLDADHLSGEARETRGQKSRARTDFEHALSLRGRHGLQYAPLDHRFHHHFAVAERQLEIGEREVAAG